MNYLRDGMTNTDFMNALDFSQKQALLSELTGLKYVSCTLSSEAATEVVRKMLQSRSANQGKTLFVDRYVSQPAIDCLGKESDIEVVVGDYAGFQPTERFFGAIVQYPNAEGSVEEYSSFIKALHKKGMKVAVAADPTALAMLAAPGDFGADFVFGTMHGSENQETADFLASSEPDGNQQPSSQKADLSQSQDAAKRIHGMTSYLNDALEVYGYGQENASFFNTLKISLPEDVSIEQFREVAEQYCIDFHYYTDGHIGVSLDDTTDEDALSDLIEVFATAADNLPTPVEEEEWTEICSLDDSLLRTN